MTLSTGLPTKYLGCKRGSLPFHSQMSFLVLVLDLNIWQDLLHFPELWAALMAVTLESSPQVQMLNVT
ncbi:hypothetical protein LDENG_00256990 [Lucifuga dentata]|nr:hypothetical protein LDENG_00256990 [Lucifuga dentata]